MVRKTRIAVLALMLTAFMAGGVTPAYADREERLSRREAREEERNAEARERRESIEPGSARSVGRALGIIAGGDGERYYKKRLYLGKKLYENDDVIIYRYYDRNGYEYTRVKHK